MRFLLCSSLLLTSSLFSLGIDDRISQLEDEMQDVRVQTVYGNYGAKTATAQPLLYNWGAYGSIEALYLKCTEGGNDFAWTDTDASPSFKGNLKYLNLDWRFAFRITAGYQFESPDWDLWAEYMRFDTTQSKSVDTPAGGGLYSNMYQLPSITGSTKLKLNVDYNTIDLNLGRNYFLRRNVSAHPFLGLRGAWIDQKQTVDISAVGSNTYEMQQKNDYGGLGIRTGSLIRWHLSRDWSFYGSLAAALMFGEFDNSIQISVLSSGVTSNSLNLNTDTRRVLPNMMADVGLTWQHLFSTARVALTLGYEFDYWWRQNQTLHINPSESFPPATHAYYRVSEDLALQGVKLNLGVDF